MEISNTLLATTIFVFFFLPGFILLRSFWASDKGALSSVNFYNYLLWGTLGSVILYFIVIMFFNLGCLLISVVPSSLYSTISHGPFIFEYYGFSPLELLEIIKEAQNQEKYDLLFNQLYKILSICLFTNISAFFFGSKLRDYIIENNLDYKFKFLKFRNELAYILNVQEHSYLTDVPADYLYIEMTILCHINSSIVLYKGILEDYKLKDEALEYIYLKKVERTGFREWAPRLESIPNDNLAESLKAINKNLKFYKLKENRMVFKSDEILNFQVTYRHL